MGVFHRIYKPLFFDRTSAPAPYSYRKRELGDEEAVKKYCLSKLEKILEDRNEEFAGLSNHLFKERLESLHIHPAS